MPAQPSSFRLGAKAGFNLSTAFVNDASESRFKPGFHAGLTVDYLLPGSFMIQSGLLFSVKGSQQDKLNGSDYIPWSPDMTHTFNQLYLELPLYGAYQVRLSDDVDMLVGGGPYLAYGIGGKTVHKLHSAVWTDGLIQRKWNTFGDGLYDKDRVWLKGEALNRFDFGAGLKVDFVYQKYVLGAEASVGMLNISNKDTYEGMKYRNAGIRLSLGYTF
jgi:hypothetical protein